MRHLKSNIKLSRTASHRAAMFKNMVTALLKHDRIRTTDTKAKELRRWADHVITLAKRGDLHARRQVLSIVKEKDVVHQLFNDAAQRFGTTNGGYTRIVKAGIRPGDAAPMSIIEVIAPRVESQSKKSPKVKPAAKQKTVKTDSTADQEVAGDETGKTDDVAKIETTTVDKPAD